MIFISLKYYLYIINNKYIAINLLKSYCLSRSYEIILINLIKNLF